MQEKGKGGGGVHVEEMFKEDEYGGGGSDGAGGGGGESKRWRWRWRWRGKGEGGGGRGRRRSLRGLLCPEKVRMTSPFEVLEEPRGPHLVLVVFGAPHEGPRSDAGCLLEGARAQGRSAWPSGAPRGTRGVPAEALFTSASGCCPPPGPPASAVRALAACLWSSALQPCACIA